MRGKASLPRSRCGKHMLPMNPAPKHHKSITQHGKPARTTCEHMPPTHLVELGEQGGGRHLHTVNCHRVALLELNLKVGGGVGGLRTGG